MGKRLLILILVLAAFACKNEVVTKLNTGEWHGTMQVASDEELPFNFSVSESEESGYLIKIRNSEEVVEIDEIETQGDSILIKMPVFEGYISGRFSETDISGNFIKESLNRVVPFKATYGERARFQTKEGAKVDVSGIWETTFNYGTDSLYVAKGIFYQDDHKVTGTIRTKTGDYRYLEGVVDGSELKLSTFDGAHVFLFKALVSDSTLVGQFYSGNHSLENFKAKRNDAYELPDAHTLTFLKEGYDSFDFTFPNEKGELISLTDARFTDKVVLVQIMGTWCPNCLDETKFYVEYLKNNPNPELQVVALAFEYAKTKEKAFKGIERLRNRVGVTYPILLAQIGTSNKTKANEKLPMLNHVLSYPTTIYIDKKGTVRKIHTGFNGPATGEKYEAFKAGFTKTLDELLAE